MGKRHSKKKMSADDRQAQAKTRVLDGQMARDYNQEMQVNKLLLLGAGESGKSTLFKQMITIYGKGYPEEDRKEFKYAVHKNTLEAMQALVKQSDNFTPVTEENLDAKAAIMELKEDDIISPVDAGFITRLWKDPGILETYTHRADFQLVDSAYYFFDKVADIAAPGYIPSEQDVLRSRVRTTGIVENHFTIDGNEFKMFDVGGQRSERKKWIHCFEGVTAVLFVAAISEYDQKCFEDDKTNRVQEALELFDKMCNSRWFQDTAMIVFLNKRDLFEEKLKKVPLTTFFEDYTGDNSYEDAARYVTKQFTDLNRQKKSVYPHVTCATDTNNVAAVFDAVKDIVLDQSLKGSGLA
mmetsp:Transcript_8566/g.9718  ORF Transcript_8566/g.9718 Transcript_8566/m.9718 type:complete len:353 (+) Transcript_8566:61-1119(+)|eukprot:CAMPEP_0205819688 /NCGR_PEP_ID=MMETSP0206-20130828/2151_1 /ASSEMBLY_ACC=CAM_ASM_000279 /TAXON_ID=36767 /ORGANISM="Euplotes focardii, Strain TN1" /LENGTH=352 /DNA_ID=CAMNT_0053113571 /DNA_START=59 /DNA_END=1117 /DNA_ORIENTATION=-